MKESSEKILKLFIQTWKEKNVIDLNKLRENVKKEKRNGLSNR